MIGKLGIDLRGWRIEGETRKKFYRLLCSNKSNISDEKKVNINPHVNFYYINKSAT